MTSEIQVEANRRNALKSTGPRDTSLTRFNALKNGLTAEKLVVTRYENREDYESLLEALLRDFQPQTAVEHILIEQMATSLWRRYRIVRAEKVDDEDEAERKKRTPFAGFPSTLKHRVDALKESTTQRLQLQLHLKHHNEPS